MEVLDRVSVIVLVAGHLRLHESKRLLQCWLCELLALLDLLSHDVGLYIVLKIVARLKHGLSGSEFLRVASRLNVEHLGILMLKRLLTSGWDFGFLVILMHRRLLLGSEAVRPIVILIFVRG